MDGIKLKQDGIAKYLRGLVGNDCSIGLHEIGLNSLYEDREETANKIMSEGLDNKRDGTTYFTVAYFGKEGHEFDINNEQSISDFYRFGDFYITMDGEESFVSKTIKQYKQSKYYKNKELDDMIKNDNYKEVIPGFKVLSKKDQ